MNSFDKTRILVYKNGIPVGYVKSVSYKNGTFTIISDKMKAKTYSSVDYAQRDIDTIVYTGLQQGYMFSLS